LEPIYIVGNPRHLDLGDLRPSDCARVRITGNSALFLGLFSGRALTLYCMGRFVVVMPERGTSESFARADGAYRWLDGHARNGDPYQLWWVDDRTGASKELMESAYQPPRSVQAA
jgi:hypothetical protein